MDPNQLQETLLSFAAVTEEEPFGPGVIVYKVLGKIFALSAYESPLEVNLKCDPAKALQLRDRYEAVNPGYHMNKKHWNTVTVNGSIPDNVLLDMIRHSYDLVVEGLPKKDQARLNEISPSKQSSRQDWRSEFLRDISR